MQNKVIEIVSNAINEFNEININKIDYDGVDTVLMGNGSKLDSLGLVSLLITIEQHITDEFEKDITIADEKAMSLHIGWHKSSRRATGEVDDAHDCWHTPSSQHGTTLSSAHTKFRA